MKNKNLILGLQILNKYGGYFKINCALIYYPDDDITAFDIKRLFELGWTFNLQEDAWSFWRGDR